MLTIVPGKQTFSAVVVVTAASVVVVVVTAASVVVVVVPSDPSHGSDVGSVTCLFDLVRSVPPSSQE